jgi:3-oxoadipate enol-lactonase
LTCEPALDGLSGPYGLAGLSGPRDAPVLVLTHAIGTGPRLWDGVAALQAGRYRLLRVAFPGHDGAPAPPGPYSLASLGACVLAAMDACGVETADYCGVSLGGMTGLWLAAHHPSRVRSLVACCAAIDPVPSRQAWLDRAALVRASGMAAIAGAMPERWFTPEFIARWPDRVAEVTGMLLATDPEGYAACGEAIAGLDLRSLLGDISVPTLVVAGEQDPAAPVWLAAQCATAIAGSRLRVIRGTSHLAPFQAPGPVADLIGHLAGASAR